MDPIIHELNSAQRAAVVSPAPVLQILAPPGSGKTKTLTARVAYLLSHHGYQPQDVICCTFTIKASREMRERLAKLVGDEVQSRLILGTFHSICRRYLVNYGYLIGLRRGFGIADSSDSLAIIKRIVKRLQVTILPNIARARISYQKAHGISPDDVAERYTSKSSKTQEHREFLLVYREYQSHLAASHLLDYDDLLVRCAELLRRHPACVSNVQAVLVDEFQDTNHIQYELMNLFASQNQRITVVGDPDQSIYGFRSAEVKNLVRMQQLYRNTDIVLLEDNYRSSASILSSAQDVIEQDTARPAKKLQATHSVGTMPVLRKLPTAEAEAQWIVLEIKRCMAITGELLGYSDFAILLRSASLSRPIESEMGKQGIPYKMVGGLRFFDRVEIKLLLDYLRVIGQPRNTDALLRIINVPSRKIGEETIRILINGAEKIKKPLWDFIKDVAQGRKSTDKILSKPANHGLCTFVGLIESSRRKLQECTDHSAPRKLLDYVIKRLSFREYLTMTYGTNEENRWANVEELLGQADDTITNDIKEESLPEIKGLLQQEAHAGEEALSRFLANVALSTEVQQQEGEEPQKGKVTISTIHAAKGLEWPVVFVPAVYDGIIPHSRADDSDEERRLLYVAMTRAQALLYLSYPLEQARSGEQTSVSGFLPERIVEQRFRCIGPSLKEQTVYGIADILRRPRPSPEAMRDGQVSVISTLDDQWTPEGWEVADAVKTRDGVRAMEEPYPKRRRHGHENWTTSSEYITRVSTLSAPTTMSSFGFSTAREYVTASAATTLTATSNSDQQGKISNLEATGQRSKAGSQRSISGFFGSRANSRGSPHQTQGSQGTSATQLLSSRNPAFKSAMPINFSSHRPQVHGPVRPTLEPSDPNRYTWMGTVSTTEAGNMKPKTNLHGDGPENRESRDSAGKSREEWGDSEIKRSEGLFGGVRPAATYHTTTMTMVQGAGSGPMRRTLGIRRSMNGWEERMKRANNSSLR